MIPTPRTDGDWLREALFAAASMSEDSDTQNGAVLVPKKGLVATAANRMPCGVQRDACRLRRPEKYRWIEHAERAAIYAACRFGTPTEGATMYCVWFACPDCARAIIQAGIREVVGHVTPRRLTPARWEADVAAGEAMLREAGVSMRWLADPMGVMIRFNGERVEC